MVASWQLKTHSQALRRPIRQPVSSAWTTWARRQLLQECVIGGVGQVGQALPGANQGTRANFEGAVGLQVITDFVVADAQAMLHLGGHRQHVGAERVAGGAHGIGGLVGMSALPALPATRQVPVSMLKRVMIGSTRGKSV